MLPEGDRLLSTAQSEHLPLKTKIMDCKKRALSPSAPDRAATHAKLASGKPHRLIEDSDEHWRVAEDPVPTKVTCTPQSMSASKHVQATPAAPIFKPVAVHPYAPPNNPLANYQPLAQRKLTAEEEAFWGSDNKDTKARV